MPELPEVETTRRGIEGYLTGQQIRHIEVRQPSLRWPVELPENLCGQWVESVARRAKYLLLNLNSGCLIIHLGMSGSLRIRSAGEVPGKHDHIDLAFGRNSILRYTDPRRFGSFHFQPGTATDHWLLSKLGVEPLAPEFCGSFLFSQTRHRKMAIKTLLMDQKVVVGVGNIYASEALFRAGIRPNIRASRLTREGAAVLADCVKATLGEAIESGGTTLKDFTAADGRPGYFKQKLAVYNRHGLPCLVCAAPIKRVATGQRMSFYCPKCQR